jgi:hypothetical protein
LPEEPPVSIPSALVRNIRQNHALEHATVHLLSRACPGVRLLGRSDIRGFTLFGQVDTDTVRRSVSEGLMRLQGHESWLATHPLCGTNLAAGALLMGGAAYAASALPARSRGVRALRGLLALGLAWPMARRAGPLAQKHLTTTPQVQGMSVRDVRCEHRGRLTIHRVLLDHDR